MYMNTELESYSEDQSTTCQTSSWTSLKEELKNCRRHFDWNFFREAFVFLFFLPLNDIVSDFLIAEKFYTTHNGIDNVWMTFFSYAFIASPGVMFFIKYFPFLLRMGNVTYSWCQGSVFPFMILMSFICLDWFLL